MSELTRAQVEAAIATYRDPYLDTDLVGAKCVKQVEIDAGTGAVSIGVTLGFMAKEHEQAVSAAISEAVAALPGAGPVTVDVRSRIGSHSVKEGLD
ncbi:MAG: iron-sulfur cluster assembly protein, partial [Gammaproteobacteria bacterium]